MSFALPNVKAASKLMHLESSGKTLSISTGHTNLYGWHGSPLSKKKKTTYPSTTKSYPSPFAQWEQSETSSASGMLSR